MSDCIFCKIIAGEIPSYKVYEDDRIVAFLDILPVSEGHTLFVPKAHATNIVESAPEDAVALIRAVQVVAPTILAAVGADGFNVGINSGESSGQVVFHTHLHVMPRKKGTPRSFEHRKATNEELLAVAEKIRAYA